METAKAYSDRFVQMLQGAQLILSDAARKEAFSKEHDIPNYLAEDVLIAPRGGGGGGGGSRAKRLRRLRVCRVCGAAGREDIW